MWRRRRLLGTGTALLASACAGPPTAEAPASAGPGQLQRWRTLQGGFLAPTLPPRMPAAAQATGMFVRWMSPSALALHGHELLVADFAQQRLWRAEAGGQLVTAIAGAPVTPGVQLALGPDLSAWVLDARARQVLRFARDGSLMQTLRLPLALGSPSSMLLADGSLTLLLADGLGAAWIEQRGGLALQVTPVLADGRRIGSLDALAPAAGATLFALDRLGACVHRVDRQGRVLQTLGRGELQQPQALASDGRGRAYVLEAQDGSLKRLREGAPGRHWSAESLGLQRIAALAADGPLLALADPMLGLVQLFSVAHDDEP